MNQGGATKSWLKVKQRGWTVEEDRGMAMPVPVELDARGRRLRAALAAVLVRDNASELRLMREWLNNWSGIGLLIAGITHQGEACSGPMPPEPSGSRLVICPMAGLRSTSRCSFRALLAAGRL